MLRNIKLKKIDSLDNSCQPDENSNSRVLNRANSASRSTKPDQFSKEYRDNQKQKIDEWKKKKAEEHRQKLSFKEAQKQKEIQSRRK